MAELVAHPPVVEPAGRPAPGASDPSQPGHVTRPSLAARPLVAVVRGYQVVRAGKPSPCRYWPSCSAYAVEALEIHGAVKGLGLAAWRIARCNPFGGHGVDPVPEKSVKKKASRRV